MMSERIEPMPEELAIAHQGRMEHFIGVQNGQAFAEWLKQKIVKEALETAHMSRLTQLAVVSGMNPTEYARLHSMLGVLRIAANPNCLGHHGAPEGEAFSKYIGMRTQKKEAHLCLTCVKEDLEHWNFSWFRRTHHLSGVDFCPSHQTPLARVLSGSPWSKLPQHWVEQGDIEIDKDLDVRLDSGSFEWRFGEIACSLLCRRGPIETAKLRDALAAKAQKLNLRISSKGKRPLASDYIARVAELPWLKRYWPEILKKEPGEYLNMLDKILTSSSFTSSGFVQTTVIAAMWESPEQVHQLFQDIERSPSISERSERKVLNVRGQPYWHGEIWGAYLASQGNLSAMSESLGQDRFTLANKMDQIGLPSLRSVDTSPAWRAYLKFQAGMPLVAACTSEKADLNEVEALIRLSCARVAYAARTVIKARKQK